MKLIFLWKRVSLNRRDRLPARPGLYAVVSLGRTLYIGKSSNINRRWNATGDWRHHRYWLASIQPFVKVAYFETRAYNRLERGLINQHRPPWNDTGKPWWGEQDNPLLGKAGAMGWMMLAKRKSNPRKQMIKFWMSAAIAAVIGALLGMSDAQWAHKLFEVLGSFGPFGV
ncbi:MAG: hypothetical protein AAFV85_23140 [Cyanobacteria bacterium J06634_6]